MAARPATSDTIAAIATAPGTGGIGIIRISGGQASSLLTRLFKPYRAHSRLESHKLYYGTICGRDGHILDEVLAVYMQAPHTYTREDVVELHSHGSHLVLQAILEEVLALGARAADPGEFTKRAFLAGRIDLTQAEAVIDLLDAQTDSGVRLAVDQLQGALFDQVAALRDALVDLLAIVEVAIDFPDDDVEIINTAAMVADLQEKVIAPLDRLLSYADKGRIIREGVHVVIAGRPNVGKSSLLNALLCDDRALVTEIPGTTRDTIEELISVKGIPVHLVDTAGIRCHGDRVEELGIERARRKLEDADLVLFVLDLAAGVTEFDRELYKSLGQKKRILVLNKCDLVSDEKCDSIRQEYLGDSHIAISARENIGLGALLETMYAEIMGDAGSVSEQVSCAPNLRHKSILEKSLTACKEAQRTLKAGAPADLLAVDLQVALDHLGDIVGLTTPDDVLDALFTRFCIGK